MQSRARASLRAVMGGIGILFVGYALSAEPPGTATNRPAGDTLDLSKKAGDDDLRVSVVVARDRAKLMHNVYAATLDAMHHHYFRRDRSTLPARAMEDVFADVADQTRIEARWIAVNTRAMSLDHEPKSAFDKKAAEEIAAGKGSYELVEKGYYHRAGAIPLSSGCVGCHAGFGAPPSKIPRFAGLVITVPLSTD